MPHKPIFVIVDTDGGVDDALALVHLARSSTTDLVAVGSVHGNVTAHAAARNSLRILELAGDTTTPVAEGAAQPLARPLHLRHPDDPVGGLTGATDRQTTDETAADQLVRLARDRPGELSLLAIGPLTNLALALATEPQLPHLLDRVIAMAGAFTVPGNITAFAESNVWHDPDAAAAVVTAGFQLTLVGLDVTRATTATREWLESVATDPTQLWGQYAAALLGNDGAALPSLPLHDPLAAALLADPELGTYQQQRVAVDLSESELRGQTRSTPVTRSTEPHSDLQETGGIANITVTVDRPLFLSRLLESLVPAR